MVKMHYCKHCHDKGIEKLYRIPDDGTPSIWLCRHILSKHPDADYSKRVREAIPSVYAWMDIEVKDG